MGLLNASSSLGAALGGVAGGALLHDAEYAGLCAVGLVSVMLAAWLLGRLRRGRASEPASQPQ